MMQDEAKGKPVLGKIGNPHVYRVGICDQWDPTAFERHRAWIGRVHAEERQRELGSARTEQSSEAHDLSGAQFKAHILIVTIPAKALDFEHNPACGKIARLHLILESLSCHQMAEFAVVDRVCSKG